MFFATQMVESPCVKPHLKVYRGANPLACASALCHLTARKSKKYVLAYKKLNFLRKTYQNL